MGHGPAGPGQDTLEERTDVFEEIPEEKMIREFVRQVAKQYDREYWLTKAREGAFPDELWQEMGAGGYLGMMIPEEHGGGGLGLQQMAVLIEEMGQHGIPLLLMVVGNVMDAGLIAKYGSAEMKERYLPPLARGDLRFCFALTEPTAGSNSFRIETSAKLDGDSYVLNGQKMFITGVDASEPEDCRGSVGRSIVSPRSSRPSAAARRGGRYLLTNRS